MKKKGSGLYFLAFALAFSVTLSACGPKIPHAIAGSEDCLSCHSSSGVKPYPASHAKQGLDNTKCQKCHQTAS